MTHNKIIEGQTMSASIRGPVRRRISWLAGSSLAAATITLSGAALAPAAALAANQCAPIGTAPSANGAAPDTFECTGSYTTDGITYSSAGNLTVNTFGAIAVGTAGIDLDGAGADSVTLTATQTGEGFLATGVITGTGGEVIDVTSQSGAINITTAGITGTNAAVTYGINAVSSSGSITIANPVGNINVTSNSGAQQSAVRAATGGGGSIDITTGATVTGRLRGIEAQVNGAGALTISTSASVSTNSTAGLANIDATTGTGLLTINLTAPASGTGTINGNRGAAIRTNAGGDAVINISGEGQAGRTVSAGNFSTAVMDLTAVGVTTVNNAGTVSASTATNAATPVAIRASGGEFVVNNDGEIRGGMDFSGLTGGWTFNNNFLASWRPLGVSDFGSAEGELNNAGTMIVISGVTFTNLEAINNSGSIDFGITREEVGDVFTLTNTDLVASGASRLQMEADFAGLGQSDCSDALAADCLIINDGDVSGVTSVLVTALGTVPTEVSPDIVLIDVNGGATGAGDFVLDPGSTNFLPDPVYGGLVGTDGLLGFALLYDEATQQHYLANVVPSHRLEYAAALDEVISIWHTTSDVVAGRQADLRDFGGAGGWLRVVGERTTRDVGLAFDAGGGAWRYDDEYELKTTAIVGGFDLAAGENFALGVHAGGIKSTLERSFSTTTDEIDGVTAGVYGGWWSESGLTLDGTVNANFLKVNYERTINEVSSTSITSVGARAEAGWRMAMGPDFYVQPLATIAYVRANIEELLQTTFDVSWDDVASLRAALGLRVGGDVGMAGGRLGYWASGRAWNEFAGDGSVMIGTVAEDVAIQDELGGEFQELNIGLELSNEEESLSGYLAGGAKFGDAIENYSASFGIRLRW